MDGVAGRACETIDDARWRSIENSITMTVVEARDDGTAVKEGIDTTRTGMTIDGAEIAADAADEGDDDAIEARETTVR